MIFNRENTKGKRVDVLDAWGEPIANVMSYNTVTQEVVVTVENQRVLGQKTKTVRMAIGADGNVILAKGYALGSSIYIDGVKQ